MIWIDVDEALRTVAWTMVFFYAIAGVMGLCALARPWARTVGAWWARNRMHAANVSSIWHRAMGETPASGRWCSDPDRVRFPFGGTAISSGKCGPVFAGSITILGGATVEQRVEFLAAGWTMQDRENGDTIFRERPANDLPGPILPTARIIQ